MLKGEYIFKVRSYECGADGFASLPSICNYLQEAASLNAEELGFSKSNFDAQGGNISWVLTRLAIREVQFCTYLLVYPHLTLDEIAQYICYSEKSIRNYKQRIAQKLGVSSADLYQHLQNNIIAYLHNEY